MNHSNYYKSLLLSACCLLFAVLGFTQNIVTAAGQQKPSVEKRLTKINLAFVGGGITHEIRLARTLSLALDGGIELQAARSPGYYYAERLLAFVPALSAEARWYYNLDKRSAQGRSTQHNRGAYTGIITGYFINTLSRQKQAFSPFRNAPYGGVFWGVQTKLATRVNLDFKIGLGGMRSYLSGKIESYGIGALRFGFIINK
jgi:hypothetical protein